MKKEVFNFNLDGKNFSVETGEIARQAGGSVLVRYEDTVVLSTATGSKEAKDLPFFPLTVSLEEKLYSVGKIPGGFLRREGRPSETATLTSRLIDRTLRPLFAEGFRNDVQVVNTVLSVDQDRPVDMAAMIGSSLALCISDIPFNGPIAGVNVGLINGEYIVNPTLEQTEQSLINLSVAGTKEAINMVEASAQEVSESVMLEALQFAHKYIVELCEWQEDIAKKIGKEKMEVTLAVVDQAIAADVKKYIEKDLRAAVAIHGKLERYNKIDALKETARNHFKEIYADDDLLEDKLADVNQVCEDIVADEVRRLISVEKIRPDGREIDEIRPLDSQIDLLPRTHGSALFTRGETQVLSVVTLGAMSDTQIIDDLSEEENKRFMHHYNFPPFSVGETGRMGAPGRREIGHGALGEKALLEVIPDEDEFPYAIRVVSEVLESNGSSSQASICASSMALMAAGVPIKAPVAGIAMGLVAYDDHISVLSDIQGMEDHYGDMDFKVAGTPKGITALQMDIKIDGISHEILTEALEQARLGREKIMDNMMKAIEEPRSDVAKYAPKMGTMRIAEDKIRDVIGPGGKKIDEIIEASDDVKIDIEDDGRVTVYHSSREAINHALSMIEAIVKEAKVGEIYDAKVVRIENFGAFVELFPGTDGLLHISQLQHKHTDKVTDVVKMGDRVKVKVTEIDNRGRVNVSRKVLLPKPLKEPVAKQNDKR